jgi:hypothetical protein
LVQEIIIVVLVLKSLINPMVIMALLLPLVCIMMGSCHGEG